MVDDIWKLVLHHIVQLTGSRENTPNPVSAVLLKCFFRCWFGWMSHGGKNGCRVFLLVMEGRVG